MTNGPQLGHWWQMENYVDTAATSKKIGGR